jgi:Fic family protein
MIRRYYHLMWIWQHPNWPSFDYNVSTFSERVEAFYRSAERLSGRIEGMASRYQFDAIVDLMLSEAITTSAIEGETLDRDSVRSSLLHLIGIDAASPNSDEKAAGAAALMVDVREKWQKPLDHDLLGGWQTMACPAVRTSLALRGVYRCDAMQIVSGPIGNYRVHYEAPPAAAVHDEMERFIDWYNQSNPYVSKSGELPGPVRAAIAHLWFESIHPFEDGNGRVGRAIADHALSQSLGRPTIACLATAINEDRKTYYDELGRASRGGVGINPFIDYFTSTINKAQEIAREEVDFVLNKARFYEVYADKLSERQGRALTRMFAEGRQGFEGGMSTKKYMAITKCSQATAARDLATLKEMGAMISLGQGRSTRYEIAYPEPNRRFS